jgi:hypothetical protein
LRKTKKNPQRNSKHWFRDVDSNHDTQLQRLMSYQLDDPGTGRCHSSLAEQHSIRTPCRRLTDGIGLEKSRLPLASAVFSNAAHGGAAARGGFHGLPWAKGFGPPVFVGPIKQRVQQKIASEDAKSHDHRK